MTSAVRRRLGGPEGPCPIRGGVADGDGTGGAVGTDSSLDFLNFADKEEEIFSENDSGSVQNSSDGMWLLLAYISI